MRAWSPHRGQKNERFNTGILAFFPTAFSFTHFQTRFLAYFRITAFVLIHFNTRIDSGLASWWLERNPRPNAAPNYPASNLRARAMRRLRGPPPGAFQINTKIHICDSMNMSQGMYKWMHLDMCSRKIKSKFDIRSRFRNILIAMTTIQLHPDIH